MDGTHIDLSQEILVLSMLEVFDGLITKSQEGHLLALAHM
jgi:hypothetical protein